MIKDLGRLSLWDETWLRTWVSMMGIKAQILLNIFMVWVFIMTLEFFFLFFTKYG